MIIRMKNKNCSKQRELDVSKMNFLRFHSEGTGEKVRLIEYLNKDLYGVRLFECSSYRESTVYPIKESDWYFMGLLGKRKRKVCLHPTNHHDLSFCF